jgi:hypothetical protein
MEEKTTSRHKAGTGDFILVGLMWIRGQTWALSKTASGTLLTKSSV